MKYFFNMNDTYCHDDHEYWTQEEISKVRIYPATPKLMKAAELEDSDLWPVFDYFTSRTSTEFVECKDEEEARNYMMLNFNHSIYERINDL